MRVRNLITAAMVAAGLQVMGAQDWGFNLTPGRVTTNGANDSLNASVNDQGGNVGDVQPGILNIADGGANIDGWFAYQNGTRFDEEITDDFAHLGEQSWRISNKTTYGIINSMITPTLNHAAGETGLTDAEGQVAASDHINFSVWFRSVAEPGEILNSESWVTFALDDGLGARFGGYVGISDNWYFNSDGVYVATYCVNNGPGDDTWGTYVLSPALPAGEWLQLEYDVTFVDGNGQTTPGLVNDIVRLTVRDVGGNVLWAADENTVFPTGVGANTHTGLTTWESAPWYSQAYAISSVQLRLSYQDFAGTPLGFYFDDFAMSNGSGDKYATSFEAPDCIGEGTVDSFFDEICNQLGGAPATSIEELNQAAQDLIDLSYKACEPDILEALGL